MSHHRIASKFTRGLLVALLLAQNLSTQAVLALGVEKEIPIGGEDQNLTVYSSIGRLCGVTDLDGKQIIAPIYADILYLGRGIFQATDPSKDGATKPAKPHLFNKSGTELSYKLPQGSRFVRIFSFGSRANKDPKVELASFGKETVLVFSKGDLIGLCDTNGTVMVQPTKPPIALYSKYAACNDGKTIIDLETRKPITEEQFQKTDALSEIGIEDETFTESGTPKGASDIVKFRQASRDRFEKVVYSQPGMFDSEVWMDRTTTAPVSGLEQFNGLLNQYNLIGMTKDNLYALLGNPDYISSDNGVVTSVFYNTPYLDNQSTFKFGPKMYLENDRVTKWSFLYGDDKESATTDKNVVIKQFVGGPGKQVVSLSPGTWPPNDESGLPVLVSKDDAQKK